ncbi:MAG: translation initiation factor IF-3 [Chloroflexi bacterium]|nr:translation initiation factor IF-3 [Chloroflexota bacterium]
MAREYRTNQRIRAATVRVIGDDGAQLGIMSREEALQLAQEKDLDLVEVAPAADPPVCRILDYGKFKYVQTKKEREAKKAQKSTALREVRFRPGIGQHDQEAKLRTVHKLLGTGAKVKLSVIFRGRSITHPEIGVTLLRRMAESLQEEAKLEKPPAMEGRSLSIILIPVARRDGQESDTAPTDQSLEEAAPVMAEAQGEDTETVVQETQHAQA